MMPAPFVKIRLKRLFTQSEIALGHTSHIWMWRNKTIRSNQYMALADHARQIKKQAVKTQNAMTRVSVHNKQEMLLGWEFPGQDVLAKMSLGLSLGVTLLSNPPDMVKSTLSADMMGATCCSHQGCVESSVLSSSVTLSG
ncbi:hypothetical protein ACH5RR_016272 [Cinchona calisaya]|uniref:Uncharacterized protein n=1 Tax=Cinchona calisaya TaxID=153742 RepID=A0ABD2ZVW3_9GENT